MGLIKPTVPDPSNVVGSLVYNLLKTFDETRDLLFTLKTKERRDYELTLRSKGYPTSRRVEYIEDEDLGGDEAVVTDKAAVTRQYENGVQDVGQIFAVGDVFSQTALQSQIITLQGVLINTLLYGPTASTPISQQITNLIAASRAAGTTSVDILAAQMQRQKSAMLPTPPSSRSPLRDNGSVRGLVPLATKVDSTSTVTSLVKYQEPSHPRAGSPVNTTIMDWRGKTKIDQTETDTTSMTGPRSVSMKSEPHELYCLYAIDLQRHRSQDLATSITSSSIPSCPHCRQNLHLSPGKAWEVRKNEDGSDRVFQVSNRFVVKCHRDNNDGQYSCILCSDHTDSVSICGDVKTLIKHIWEEHSIGDLKHEEDITEVVDLPVDRRRDSGLGYTSSRSSRRSASLGPSQRRNTMARDREQGPYEFRSSRRYP